MTTMTASTKPLAMIPVVPAVAKHTGPKIPEPNVEDESFDKKTITINKLPGGRWDIKFTGKIRQLDINHLRRMLHVEFARVKRKNRLTKRAESRRAAEAHKNKEPLNG